jgi:hypothetical protein
LREKATQPEVVQQASAHSTAVLIVFETGWFGRSPPLRSKPLYMEMLQDGCAAAEEESTSALNPAPKKRRSIFSRVEVARWEVAR